MAFVSIRDLKVSFSGVQVLHGINLDIDRGETLGLVGESGCGKSVTWLAALGLLPGKTSVSGSVVVDGQQLIGAPRHAQESVRGGRVAMIFQDPSSSLNPVKKVGPQIVESLSLHRGLKGSAAWLEAVKLMERVGIPDAARRFDLFPHEFSGGQCQRIMIAIALAGEPDVLIADEPTTALDVTIQAQILDLLNQIRQETGMAIVFISHDLGQSARYASGCASCMPDVSWKLRKRRNCLRRRSILIHWVCLMPFRGSMVVAKGCALFRVRFPIPDTCRKAVPSRRAVRRQRNNVKNIFLSFGS